MNQYTFPFSTFETPDKKGYFAQPYSAVVNIGICLMIFYFLCKTKNVHSFLLLFSILCFEFFHTFAHAIHIQGIIQLLIIHSLAFLVNGSLLYALYKNTKKYPETEFILFLLLFVSLDIYSLLNLSFIYYFMTQVILFIGILFYYMPLLLPSLKKSIYILGLLSVFIIFLEMNEINNCEYMLRINPSFPYHILIELAGFAFFYIFCSKFYDL